MSRGWRGSLLSGLLVAVSAAVYAADLRSAAPEARAVEAPPPAVPTAVLYDQMDNPATDNVTSQDFEAAFDSFDSQAADDFVVPAAGWSVTGIDVAGVYTGTGPAASFHVYFYADAAGLPGALVASRLAQPFTGSAGNASITLTSPVILGGGTYWLSVQAREDFSPNGQWFWGNRAVTANTAAAWQNPGGGFGSPCTTWGVKTTCLPTQVGPDELFRINGTVNGGAWTTEAPLATDVYGATAVGAEGLIYAGGGYTFTGGTDGTAFQSWNPETNAWTPRAALPDNQATMGSMVYGGNGRIYLFGGETVAGSTLSTATRIYDIATDSWSAGAPMPAVRAFMSAGYYGGSIYLAGGYIDTTVSAQNQLWRYDLATNTWDTSLANLPVPIGGAGSAVIDGVLYVAGGRDPGGIYATLYAYDIASNTWSTRASMPAPNNVPGAAVFSGQLWIFGGGNPFLTSPQAFALPRAPETTGDCTAYDPASNTWSACPSLNFPRSFVAGASVRNIPVAIGGYNGSTTTPVVEANFGAPELFVDGFESGSTCRWSNAGVNYGFSSSTGAAIVPGVTDTGNHTDDGSTVVTLPFFTKIYDQWFNTVAVGSNGHLTFGTVSNAFNPGCMPIPTATYAVFPYLTDQCTGACTGVTCPGCGIFTSTTGTAPHRIFNIEYRTAYYNSGGAGIPLNYEVRLYEGLNRYEVIYGTVNPFTPPSARTLSVGTQLSQASGDFTLVGCDATGGAAPPVAAGEKLTFEACNQP